MQPFHGVVYPDGHPWNAREVQALFGDAAFEELRRRTFRVEYFDGEFRTRKKESLTPRIDFDLDDEPGCGSPDASAGLGKDHFSIRWTGQLVAPASGTYTFSADSDGAARLWVGEEQVLRKDEHRRRKAQGTIRLQAGRSYPLRIEYVHRVGPASQHVYWTTHGLQRQVLVLND